MRSLVLPQPEVSADVVGSAAHEDERPFAERSSSADKGQASFGVCPPGGGGRSEPRELRGGCSVEPVPGHAVEG